MRDRRTRGLLLLAVCASAAAAVGGIAASATAGNSDSYTVKVPAIKGPAVSSLGTKPHLGNVGNHCGLFFGVSDDLACYDPAQIRNAYNVPSNLDGSGQTIVIVVAYGDPTIEDDLAFFDELFDLPAPPSLTIYGGSATKKAGPHDAAGWAVETALDVEWAHAIAPGANLVLAEAPSSTGNALNTTEAQIVPEYPGAIVSQTFGINENAMKGNNSNSIQWKQADKNYQQFAALQDTVLASAGDDGATDTSNANTADYPASDPWVTGVGGTQGLPYPYGLCPSTTSDSCTYGGEQVWNEPDQPAAGGGGISQLFSSPSYQSGLGNANRTVPDVSFNAAVNGGVLVIQGSYVYIVGGTSAGTPQWAGIFALVDQARASKNVGPIGFADPALYAIYHGPNYGADFHDITVGNNTDAGAPVQGYPAGPGYDLASGLGTPNVANLVADLAK
jgi:subtilase family serine protease